MTHHDIEPTIEDRTTTRSENGRDMMSSGVTPTAMRKDGALYTIKYNISETPVIAEIIDSIVIEHGEFTGKVLSIDFSNSKEENVNVLDQLETTLEAIHLNIEIIKREIVNNFH